MWLAPALALALAARASAAAPRVLSHAYDVTWLTPTAETDASAFRGSMPLGNGDATAQPWADLAAGGVSLYLAKGNAQHSDALPYKLALLTVALEPNPFAQQAPPGGFFNQTLDFATATVRVHAGGASLATAAANISVWVDANSNTVYVEVSALAPVALTATLTPVRPLGYPSYVADWRCQATTSQPDVVVDPLPPAAGFPSPATLALFHRNDVDNDLAGGNAIESILTAEGLAPAIPLVPDLWKGLRFGLAVDGGGGGGGGALERTSPTTLASVAAGTAFTVRASVLAAQTPSDDAGWLAALAAQVAAQPASGPPRAAHEAYWTSFWQRSWIDIDADALPVPPPPPRPTAAAAAAAAPAALPVAGASLWLLASTLQQPNNSAVATWADGSGAGASVSQANASAQPRLVVDAFGAGLPGVAFDGASTFLAGAAAAVPASGSTMLAVFRDDGSETDCCSGVVFFGPRDAPMGLSTVSGAGGNVGAVDDDDGNAAQGEPPVVAMLDFAGSHVYGSLNVRGRLVHAAAVFAPTGSALHVDGCLAATAAQASLASAGGVMVGSRNAEMGRYFRGAVGEVVVFPRALNASELGAMADYFAARWPVLPPKEHCHAGAPSPGLAVSQAYAASRFQNAVQSRAVLPLSSASPPPAIIKRVRALTQHR